MNDYHAMLAAGQSLSLRDASAMSRRSFVKLTGLGGLALAVVPGAAIRAAADNPNKPLTTAQQPGGFVHIAPGGQVTVTVNRLEFGQGSHTGLARVLAEELDADWSTVHAVLAPAGEAFKDPAFGIQMTGGSNSIKNSFTPVSRAWRACALHADQCRCQGMGSARCAGQH